jgi:hypothetical protein
LKWPAFAYVFTVGAAAEDAVAGDSEDAVAGDSSDAAAITDTRTAHCGPGEWMNLMSDSLKIDSDVTYLFIHACP